MEVAVDAARRADVAVIFAGLNETGESEGFDRTSSTCPTEQVELIRAVAAVGPRTVVVLANGGVVSLEGWHDDVDAILEGFLLGQAGGHAIADILFGRRQPVRALAETIPLRVQDHPSSLNFPGEQGHVRYGEGVIVGYRYFTTYGAPVRYPFGHGLSYTTFETSELRRGVTGDDTATRERQRQQRRRPAGKHVVQLYVATDAGPVRRPVRELRGFEKVDLAAGETKTVGIRASTAARSRTGTFSRALGGRPRRVPVQVCADANTVLHEQTITLPGDRSSAN